MRRTAAALALVGGILLITSGLRGNLQLWEIVVTWAREAVQDPAQRRILTLIVRVFMVLASLGGLSVIIGGYLVYKKRTLSGKLLIFLGAATGLIGILIGVGLTLADTGSYQAYFTEELNGTVGTFGVILSYAARKVA